MYFLHLESNVITKFSTLWFVCFAMSSFIQSQNDTLLIRYTFTKMVESMVSYDTNTVKQSFASKSHLNSILQSKNGENIVNT
jgi:hypothetical protein